MQEPEETLEELTFILDELKERSHGEVVLVEGLKDRAALTVLGIDGEVWQVQGPNPIFSITERLATEGRSAIILTDWDRKGGQLARLLRDGLKANGVRYDDELRRRLVFLVKKDIKDIESLPAFFTRLVSMAHNPDLMAKMKEVRVRKGQKDHQPKP